MSKKIGAFSKVEIQYLVEHCKTDTIEEMAEELNRTEETVKKQMMERGLYLEKTNEQIEHEAKIKQELYRRSWWPSIHLSCNDMELKYFEDFWVGKMQDANNEVTNTEASYIKDLGLLEIDKLRLLIGQKEARDKIGELEDIIAGFPAIEDRSPTENLLYNQTVSELALCKGAVGEHTSNLTKINADFDKIDKKLKLDREVKRDKETTADSFWALVRILDDQQQREQNEQLAELMKASMMKAKRKLSENHVYVDNEVDRPILNSDTLELDEE